MPTVMDSSLAASITVSLSARDRRSGDPTAQLLFFERRSRSRLCAAPRPAVDSRAAAAGFPPPSDRTWTLDLVCEAPRLAERHPRARAARLSKAKNTILPGAAGHRLHRIL